MNATPTFTPEQQAERLHLGLRASYEVDSIAMHMRDNLPAEQEYAYLRALVLRILDLNGVAMSVLGGDEGRSTAEMRRALAG